MLAYKAIAHKTIYCQYNIYYHYTIEKMKDLRKIVFF